MWAGLRVLRAEAKRRGLSEEQVDRLLWSAFHQFHDAAESIWTALKAVQTIPPHHGRLREDFWAPAVPLLPWGKDLVSASWYGDPPGTASSAAAWPEALVATKECEGRLTPAEVFVACEEDRTIPVKTPLHKPLTLLDPDAEILATFEP